MVAFNRFAFGVVCVALALSACAALLPLDVCKERAAVGDAEALWQLGQRYETGEGVRSARQRLVTAYVELRAWGLDADSAVSPVVGAYRAYASDRAWKGLNDRNPKKRNLACTALTRLDANLNEAIDRLYDPLLAKKAAAFRAWEQAHPELARALAEKRRTAEIEAQIRKANLRAARAEEAARMAQNEAAAAAAAADDAARRAEEAERNARNAEWRARNAELGWP